MPRRCSICDHPNRTAIDQALVGGSESLRSIADRYGLTKSAIIRHRDHHLPEHLAQAQQAQEVLQADQLLTQVQALQVKALGILSRAERAGELRTALGAIREARANLELMAKLVGQLHPEEAVGISLSTEWVTLRATILAALVPFPAAHEAVVHALEDADVHA